MGTYLDFINFIRTLVKLAIWTFLFCPSHALAGEAQFFVSGDMWGYPAFSGPGSNTGDFSVGSGFGYSTGLSYLFENGIIVGVAYRTVGFSYSQSGTPTNSFSSTDAYSTAQAGYWWKLSENRTQIQTSIEFGTGTMSLTGAAQPAQAQNAQLLGMNLDLVQSVASLDKSGRFFWIAGLQLFRRYYNFSYGGANVSAATSSGTGTVMHFNLGLGLWF